ncbi:putative O-methyltransferase YrrM [Nocardia tenerifensis]|uniref:Putative O-methyltransferase YrrM n=1 Tax=Nocardia tenerifensis TaxID=228006 RepID=A0A318KAU1_9NOCA|nr:class I SAM-dependent methyltransferase [Nocardia tenerifensis]PXX53955.1 putative O-methyltransferase YrrM [Nocardia tenerifensis]
MMIDELSLDDIPPRVQAAHLAAAAADYQCSCTNRIGAMLRMLAATKPGGVILELGTGAGVAAAWLLDGMNPDACLHTVEWDSVSSARARHVLRDDTRATVHCIDAQTYIDTYDGPLFDLIFADCAHPLGPVVDLLAPGGLYVVDDLMQQTSWEPGEQARVDQLVRELRADPRLHVMSMRWDSGLLIAARIQDSPYVAIRPRRSA